MEVNAVCLPLMVSNYESREISFRGRRPAQWAHRSTFLTLCRQTTSAPWQRSVFPWGFFLFIYCKPHPEVYCSTHAKTKRAIFWDLFYLFTYFLFFACCVGLWGPGIHSFRTLMYWLDLSCGLDDLLRLVHDSVGRGERKETTAGRAEMALNEGGGRESSTLRPPLMSLSQQK